MRFRVFAASMRGAWLRHAPTPAFVLGILLVSWLAFGSMPAVADVPPAVLERMADIRVEMAEARHLNAIGQLSNQDYNSRSDSLRKEEAAVWEPYRKISREELTSARSTIDGTVKAKLALLIPQWQQAENEFRDADKQRQKQLAADLEDDTRRAAELQRQRLSLQKQLDAGAIVHDAFAAKDREALDGIATIRKKYETAGGSWPGRFDDRLQAITQAIVASPDTPLPVSQVPVAAPPQVPIAAVPQVPSVAAAAQVPAVAAAPQLPPDFDRDVKLAADIAVRQQELHFQFAKKQISGDAFRESDVVYDRDLSRLKQRYQAISMAREEEFENAYRRLAEPQLQALRVKYYPGQYEPAAAPAPAPALGPAGLTHVSQTHDEGISTGLLFITIIGIPAAIYVGIHLLLKRIFAPKPPPLTANFGSASYAAQETAPRSPASTANGIFLGKSIRPHQRGTGLSGPGAPVVTTPEHHTLIVARTRTGKGTRVIVPTLLRYAGNMFVIDPKGENAAITARARRDTMHQTVHVLNPWGIMAKLYAGQGIAPATYNPLDILDRDDPNAVAIARRLAGAISPVTGRGDDAFWQQSAANILAAVFLWLADHPGETKTLARAREIVTLDRKSFTDKYLVRMAASEAFHGAIREMVGNLLDLADNTYTGINASLTLATIFISDPQLKAATNVSTFSMADLRDLPTTLYLVIPPDEVETQRTWLRLLIAAATHSFRRPASLTPPRRSMMLIDEFPALGKLQDLPADIATMAGYGLDYTLVVQGIDQLKSIYGDDSGAILSNCAYKWYCNVTDLTGAKHLSESLGEATIRTVSQSISTGVGGGGGATQGESITYGEKGRKLLTPDEILHLGRDVAIVFQPEGLPVYVKPIDYWNLKEAFAHLEHSHAALYWQPPLAYDDNPYVGRPQPVGAVPAGE